MKISVKIQEILAVAGIDPNKSNRFNWKIALWFLLFILNILSSIIAISIIEENNLTAYVDGFYTISGLIEMGFSLAATVLQQVKLFEIFKTIEQIINQSNTSRFY